MSFFAELKRRNVIRVAIAYVLIAWVSLQAIDFVLDVIAAPDWVIQALVAVAGVGLLGFCVFAWVFEMTPEGLKRESEIDRSRSITPQTGRKLDSVIIVFLAVLVAFLLADRYYLDEDESEYEAVVAAQRAEEVARSAVAREEAAPSIAVLPFVDMSPAGDQAYFSDGIAEEILNVLVKTDRLKVAGRTSSFQFRGREEDLRDIGQKLGVEHILEGSVRKAGKRVRITAQLVKAEDGFHLWSETYDRELDDIFAVQDEIARSITDALAVHLDLAGEPLVEASTTNMAAYEKYLAGRALVVARTDFSHARQLLEEATRLDPAFAPAWAALAQAWALAWYYEPVDQDEVLARAEEMAQRALQHDPDLSTAWSVLGDVYRDRGEWDRAQRHYEEALARNPGDIEANEQYAQMLLRLGYIDRARPYSERATAGDPLSWINLTIHGLLLYMAGEREAGWDYTRRSMAASGGFREFQLRTAIRMALSDGDRQQAIELTHQLVGSRLDDELPAELMEPLQELLERLDDPQALLAFLRENTTGHYVPGPLSLWELNLFWAVHLGDLQLAADILHGGLENEPTVDANWLFMPGLRPLFEREPGLMKRAFTHSGAVAFWREHGFPDHCRPLPGDDFECTPP